MNILVHSFSMNMMVVSSIRFSESFHTCSISTEGTRFSLMPEVRKDCSKSCCTVGILTFASLVTNS